VSTDEDQPRPYGAFALGDLLGLELEPPQDGVCLARLEADERHQNPNGVVHGAVLFAMVDTAMGGATMSVLDEGRICASIDVHLRFLKPVFGGPLEARVEVVRAGRRVVHLEGRVRNGDGEVVAMATGSFAVLELG
jgi:acyl-CoA thioesterase